MPIQNDPDHIWISTLSLESLRNYARNIEAQGMASLPLYGVPFAIKDNIDLATLPTTAACPAFAYTPSDSATVVQRLIDAGAIPIGKTNHSLRKILLGDALSVSSRSQLTQWMLDDQVAGALLPASLPSDWKIADKTGAGGYGSRSIVAVIWPPSKQPLVVGIYITQTKASMQASNQAIARLGVVLKDTVAPCCG